MATNRCKHMSTELYPSDFRCNDSFISSAVSITCILFSCLAVSNHICIYTAYCYVVLYTQRCEGAEWFLISPMQCPHKKFLFMMHICSMIDWMKLCARFRSNSFVRWQSSCRSHFLARSLSRSKSFGINIYKIFTIPCLLYIQTDPESRVN